MVETTCGHQPHHARGLCENCYRKKLQKDVIPRIILRKRKPTTCGHQPHYGKGLCRNCFSREKYKRLHPPKPPPEIKICKH